MNPIPVYLPKETVSDDRYLISRLYAKNGSKVNKGDLLLAFETSKATVDLESEQAGYFFTRLQEGQEVAVGALAGLIASTPEITDSDWPADLEPQIPVETQEIAPMRDPASPHPNGPRISRPAQALIQQHSLDPRLFGGLPLVRREDVQRILEDQAGRAPQAATGGKPRIFILGGGGHAKMCLDILAQTGEFEVVGILDGGLAASSQVLGVPVLGADNAEEMARLYEQGVHLAVNGVGAAGNHPYRSEVYARLRQAGFSLPNLIHPCAVVEPSATLGEGNQIMAGAVVGSDVHIGNNCIVNSNAVISHDSHLADNVHIAPGALLAGNVQVGADTLVGMGVTLFLGLRIGSRVIIANGLNVFKDVPDGSFIRH
ncbi:MAG TPA: NeuD/PglB/VioB family sugar acetyltransferase [Anaerolineaceae bacterium]|nr:NeuD/PglB/VioB family sugar acetyltransferase [Anaerolineaceae bacterium]